MQSSSIISFLESYFLSDFWILEKCIYIIYKVREHYYIYKKVKSKTRQPLSYSPEGENFRR